MAVFKFPEGFLWGCATASYQIEGSPLEDGAGASIWHTFSHEPGRITNDDNGDVANDHYHRYREDVGLMKELGLKAYRFSFSWPRVLHEGRGEANPKGLDFYDRLVDELLAANIQPMPTMYHWDLPQAIEDVGGWVNPDTAEWFAEYAATLYGRLGDRVKRWITFNEPWVFIYLGYAVGIHAPGRSNPAEALQAGHVMLRANGLAVQRFRQMVPDGEVGITQSMEAILPYSDDPKDAEAAERQAHFRNYWLSDPVFTGEYPSGMIEQFGDLMPTMTQEDSATIRQPVDFVGVNYYTRELVQWQDGAFFNAAPQHPIGHRTDMEWEIYPAGLYQLLKEVYDRYKVPIYITENGAGFDENESGWRNEKPNADGSVDDWDRLRYLQSHFEAAHRAIADGVDLRGYFVWSLLDNFEWGFGYGKRFGIVRCDFDTLERTPKRSYYWYQRVIEENGI